MNTRRRDAQKPSGPPELLLNLVNRLDAMLAYWDRDQVCRFANDAYFRWFGVKPEGLVGRMTMKELLGPLYEKNLPHIRAAFAGEAQTFEREIPTPDGEVRYSLARYIPDRVDGQVRGIFVHVVDVTHMKKLQDELMAAKEEAERLATHDPLTGLPNRVMLFDRIAQALALSRRTGRIVAGMTVDLDDFKRVNDTYGHDIGDMLLVEVASRITSALREYDSATRTGGDEFFILTPEISTRAEGGIVASHLLSAVTAPFEMDGTSIVPACSIGIALSSPDVLTPEELIKDSDLALYEAKKLGKNRYAFCN